MIEQQHDMIAIQPAEGRPVSETASAHPSSAVKDTAIELDFSNHAETSLNHGLLRSQNCQSAAESLTEAAPKKQAFGKNGKTPAPDGTKGRSGGSQGRGRGLLGSQTGGRGRGRHRINLE